MIGFKIDPLDFSCIFEVTVQLKGEWTMGGLFALLPV
jgi:hypothetical protein